MKPWMLAGSACLSAVGMPAFAQVAESATSARTDEGEIVVTAQRREEGLEDVPIAITVLSGDTIESFRFQDATQIVQQIPNMSATNTLGASAPLFSVRGMSNADFNPSSNTPVPIYADDILINNVTGQGFALFDLQRVEALKGPQGTLFGYNSSAGAIQFISRRPTSTLEGSGSASFAGHGERTLNLAVGGPIAGDSVRGRLAFFGRRDDGDFVNINDGERIGKDNRWSVRGLLDIDLASNASVLLKAQYGKYDGAPSIRPTEQAVNNFTGEILGNKREIRQELGQYENVEYGELSSRANIDLGPVGLDLITGYLDIKSGLSTNFFDGTQIGLLDLGYGAGPVQTALYGVQGGTAHSKQFSQEVRITSQTDGPLSFIIGAYYLKEKLDGSIWFYAGDDSGAFGYFGTDPAAFLTYSIYKQNLSSAALFSQWDYKFNDKLKLTIGGRVSWDKRSLDLSFANYDGATTFVNPAAIDPLHPKFSDVTDLSGLERSQQKRDWTNWSGRLALDYQPSPDTLLYASLSRGVKSGAFNTAALVDISEANSIGPETVLAYETGVKLTLADRRIQTNFAAFYYDVDNYHQKVVDQFAREFLSSADKVEFYGFELEATARPIDIMTAKLGAGWQKGKYKRFIEPTGTGPIDRSGNIVPGTGSWTVNGLVKLDLPIGTKALISPQADFNYVQGNYYWTGNGVKAPQLTPDSKTDDFFNLNLRLTLQDADERYGITFFVQNVLDQFRVVRRNPVSFLDNTLSGYSPPRTFGVSINGRF
ncbi:Outer membrane receptor proteins, mostly Fe transport [Sphingopyxis sp. YR583]|nr:Outer membrane receptor proteins, mostly Fe transport [Sphingopyxis sp. YR583]